MRCRCWCGSSAADKLEVREAARAAVARFGKNAVWQMRQLYSEVAGKAADKRWDAERTAHELYAVLDRDAREQRRRAARARACRSSWPAA